MNQAIILAAGNGARLQKSSTQPTRDSKIWAPIGAKPLLWYSLNAFVTHPQIDRVVVVGRAQDKERLGESLNEWGMPDVQVIEGGVNRQESAVRGFQALSKNSSNIILFHNAANPFVTEREITDVIEAAQESGAAGVGHPAVDTLKQVDSSGRVLQTLDRSNIWQMQTPQAIREELYQRSLDSIGPHPMETHPTAPPSAFTDDLMPIEALGVQPIVVPASHDNRKITFAEDLEWARGIIAAPDIRFGVGQDSHRFHPTKKGLTLGGLHLPNEPQLQANSDGDVMLHALGNGILQAIDHEGSLSTIADPLVKQGTTDSAKILKEILLLMNQQQFKLNAVGFQLEGARPKIDPLNADLKTSLSGLLKLKKDRIGITATTGEDLTAFGRGEGLQCWATVVLKREPNEDKISRGALRGDSTPL